MKPENIVSVIFITLFLLFAYFMIGGYTPCGEYRYYDNHDVPTKYHTIYPTFAHMAYGQTNSQYNSQHKPVYDSNIYDSNTDLSSNKSIYEYGPYLNI